MSDLPTVPQPPVKPIIGNLSEIDTAAPVQSLMKLPRTYGLFYQDQLHPFVGAMVRS